MAFDPNRITTSTIYMVVDPNSDTSKGYQSKTDAEKASKAIPGSTVVAHTLYHRKFQIMTRP